ncbi:hypothetical protein [Thermoflexibacter ruber]|uniref:Lipoprotein n=1 Tax=Thermoflexibacter ruber TaxID=1003 RepID=A0A1I2H923_9BACT|nr:hypothetical protein [Thermoflexibacter ruber]SFF26162.1 hypothetical protein SAMN04488541_102261 [Thermoflexibacter ruber]
MMTKINVAYCVFIMLLFIACGQIDTQRQSDTLKKEMKAKKLKRLTEGQIQTAALEEGKSIVLRLEGILLSIADTNNFDCEEFKNIQFQNEVLMSFKLFCQQSPEMNEKERQIWEAYQNNLSQKLPIGDNLQKLGQTEFLYSAPLYIKNQYRGLWSIVLSKKEIVRKM